MMGSQYAQHSKANCMKAWRWPTNKVETCSLIYNNKIDVQFVLIHLYTQKDIVTSSVKMRTVAHKCPKSET